MSILCIIFAADIESVSDEVDDAITCSRYDLGRTL